MNEKIKTIVDAVKINVELAKLNGKPILAEVSMNEKSKKYIAQMIEQYGNECYLDGSKDINANFLNYENLSYKELQEIHSKLRKDFIEVDKRLKEFEKSIGRYSDGGRGSYPRILKPNHFG